MSKNLRPKVESKASERMARAGITLIVIGSIAVAALKFYGILKPFEKQTTRPVTTPIPDPPSELPMPKL